VDRRSAKVELRNPAFSWSPLVDVASKHSAHSWYSDQCVFLKEFKDVAKVANIHKKT
jgi:hypothetical protein